MPRSLAPLALLFLLSSACAQPTTTDRTVELDAAVNEHFSANEPGAAILVAKEGKVIYERAVGLADVANATPLRIDNVFRIGSVTKQFTAVAILQLADAGKLKLTDEIQMYVDFPRKEQPITIEHLLTHTSGIPNYTDLPSFTPEAYDKDVSVADMIALFADLPLEFAPGTQWNYSNSGYILLGAILERVSGSSWETYLTQHIFTPADMKHTSASAVNSQLANEVLGYAEGDAGYQPSTPLSMTWPYAAGTMRSTVRDLYTWNKAVFAGDIVPAKWLEKAHTNHRLADGSDSGYGYGWMFMNVQGRGTIEHGGGINGFVSSSLYLPAEDIYVVVLSNRETGDASALAPKLAAIALGEPYGGTLAPLDTATAARYTGVYVNAEGVERYITADEKGLHSQRQGSTLRDLDHLGNDRFMVHGDVITLTFKRTKGDVTGALLRSRRGDEQLTRTNKALPVRTEVKLDATTLKKYVGVFQLSGGLKLTFRADGDRLFVTASRQQEVEVFAERADMFFLKVVDARIEFYTEADGSVRRVKLIQGGEDEGVRLE